ncbi:MAG TPA: hypothetical protein VL916_05180 [Ilumatobacteraceae bacterium]|nr:hypothetical protein [Ilumatobacteraceae bacterium]
MSRLRLVALVVGALVAAAAGWLVGDRLGNDDSAASASAVELTSCPTDDGGATIGHLESGDEVWIIGVTGDRWAVIRHPQQPLRPAWVPLTDIETGAHAGDLPQLACEEAEAVAATTTTAGPATSVVIGTTTTLPFVAPSTSSTLPPTTAPNDGVPPFVTVTPERPYLYVSTPVAPCSTESELLVAITVADPTLPTAVRSIVATWNSPAGPQTASLAPAGGNRFRLVVTANGPVGGEVPLTLTATGVDGAGNVGSGFAVVSLRDPNSFGCPT